MFSRRAIAFLICATAFVVPWGAGALAFFLVFLLEDTGTNYPVISMIAGLVMFLVGQAVAFNALQRLERRMRWPELAYASLAAGLVVPPVVGAILAGEDGDTVMWGIVIVLLVFGWNAVAVYRAGTRDL